MRAVHKYELGLCGTQLVSMPVGAEVLSVEKQNGSPVLYALVSTDTTRLVVRHFRVAMTGEVIGELDGEKFIGTAMLQDGQFVVHVFEVTPSALSEARDAWERGQ